MITSFLIVLDIVLVELIKCIMRLKKNSPEMAENDLINIALREGQLVIPHSLVETLLTTMGGQ